MLFQNVLEIPSSLFSWGKEGGGREFICPHFPPLTGLWEVKGLGRHSFSNLFPSLFKIVSSSVKTEITISASHRVLWGLIKVHKVLRITVKDYQLILLVNPGWGSLSFTSGPELLHSVIISPKMLILSIFNCITVDHDCTRLWIHFMKKLVSS